MQKSSILILALLTTLTSTTSAKETIRSTNFFHKITYKAAPLSAPDTDKQFLKLPNGKRLDQLSVRGRKLCLITGGGASFTKRKQKEFDRLYKEGTSVEDAPVQWVLRNLDTGKVIDQSRDANMKMFGASVSKIFVGATLLDEREGNLSSRELQKLAEMISVSSNVAWIDLQRTIGNGNANEGRRKITDFTQNMGYKRTRGFQGYLGKIHGNELTASELGDFLYDTYWGRYDGAEILWKVMYTCRTGGSKANKYLPNSLYLGGKTGTYSGTTVHPETGAAKNADGSPFKVNVRNPQKELVDPAELGTRNVLEEANRTPSVKRVVLTSSCAAVYGDNADLQQTPMANKTMTRKIITRNIDLPWISDNSKGIRELGMSYRPLAESMNDFFQQMVDAGTFES